LRREGCSPKQIARALGMSPSAVVPLVRAVAAEADTGSSGPTTPGLVGCWVSPDWASGLAVDGHPGWPGLPAAEDSGPAGW
jgi:hypothetical protein